MISPVSQINAEIARLVAEGASPDRLAAGRERRACVERNQEKADTERLIARIEARAAESCSGARLSWQEVKLLAAELRRLRGGLA